MQEKAFKTIFVERASKSVFLRYVNILKTSFLPTATALVKRALLHASYGPKNAW
jgi:hypothetical protein